MQYIQFQNQNASLVPTPPAGGSNLFIDLSDFNIKAKDENGLIHGGGPRYKVFTALLTQSGGDGQIDISSGTLIVGVSYIIDVYSAGDDFTNVGAPNNNDGTWFIATGTTPASWTAGTNLVYNTGAPIVTVLENTIGNVWFNYTAAGVYTMASDGLFSTEKTLGFITYNDGGPSGLNDKPFLSIYPNNDYNIYVNSALDGVLSDSVLFYAPIEIRVYN